MIDIACNALSATPVAGGPQRQSYTALKHQIYLFVIGLLIIFSEEPVYHDSMPVFVKAD